MILMEDTACALNKKKQEEKIIFFFGKIGLYRRCLSFNNLFLNYNCLNSTYDLFYCP